MTDPAALSSALIGEIFVERGHITSDQLQEALAAQAQTGELLGEILVSRYDVPRVELAGVLAEQWAMMERAAPAGPSAPAQSLSGANGAIEVVSGPTEVDVDIERRPIGEIFVEHGVVTQNQLESALTAQGDSGQRLGEVLVAQGAITRLELASALAEQWSTLQKIRPPEPKSAEAWQESAVRAAGEPGTEPTTISPPAADVENLRDAVKALEERLRTVSASSSPSPPDEELRETTAALADRIDGLESRIDGVSSPDLGELHNTVAEIRTSLGELQARLEAPNQSIIDLEQRLETAVDGLLARVESLSVQSHEATSHDDDALSGLRKSVVVLEQQTSALVGRDEVDAIRVALGAVSEQVKELAGRTNGVTHDELERRVGDAVNDLRERLEAVEPQRDDAVVADLRASLANVESRLEGLQPPAPDSGGVVPEVAMRIDELAARVDQVLAGSTETVQSALQPFEQRIAELSQQLGSLPSPDRVAELDARLTEVSEQEAKARAELIARLDGEHAATATWAQSEEVAALATRLNELGLRIESLPSTKQVAAVERELDEVREAVHGLPPVPGPEVIEEVRSSLTDLSARVREVAARPVGVSQDHLERRLTDIFEGLAATAQAAQPSDEVAAEVASIHEALAALEQQVALGQQVAEGAAAETVAGLDAKVEGVGARVDELVASVAAMGLRGSEELTKEQVEELIGGERAAREALAARLEELRVAGQPDNELRAAMAGVQRQLAELADLHAHVAGLPELQQRVAELSKLEQQSGKLAELGHQLDGLGHQVAGLTETRIAAEALPEQLREQGVALDELRQRIAELAEPTAQVAEIQKLQDRLSGLGDQVARLATLPEKVANLDELRHRIAQLAERADSTEALAALETSFAERHELEAAARGSLEAQLADVTTGISSLDELRGQVEALSAEHRDVVRQGELDELRNRLSELGGTLDGLASADWVASVEQASGAASHAVGERLDGIEQRLSGLDHSADFAQVHTVVGDLSARLGGLDSGLADLRTSVDDTVSSAIGSALEHSVSHEALNQLAADLRERVAEVEAANAPTRAALDELGMRLGTTEQQAWKLPEELDDRFARFHQELSGRIEALGSSHDSALTALHGRLDELAGATGSEAERLAGLEHLAASVNVRLEGLEVRQALDGTVSDQIAALTARLDTELAVAEERGAATERAIRKGLAGLGERLAANEETYFESGAALRRSIERLGAAVVEADARLVDSPLDPPEYGYVAFVPTADGYRLRPLDGAAPEVGDVLELEGAAGPLRVTRVARSPLPLDRRVCAYLEHV
jgi:uncharacterized phage infection (PIP) family protein YhgE